MFYNSYQYSSIQQSIYGSPLSTLFGFITIFMLIFSIILIIFTLTFFIRVRFYSLKLFNSQESSWKWYFYLDYLLLIPLIFILFPSGAIGFIGFVLPLLIIPIIIIFDITLLFKSFKSQNGKAFFYNILILILVLIPLYYYIFKNLNAGW